MFRRDDDSGSFGDIVDEVKARSTRSQDETCDFCGSSEGSVIVSRGEHHPDVSDSPPVVRCRDCFNDISTYPSEGSDDV